MNDGENVPVATDGVSKGGRRLKYLPFIAVHRYRLFSYLI